MRNITECSWYNYAKASIFGVLKTSTFGYMLRLPLLECSKHPHQIGCCVNLPLLDGHIIHFWNELDAILVLPCLEWTKHPILELDAMLHISLLEGHIIPLLEWVRCHVKSSTFGVFKASTFGCHLNASAYGVFKTSTFGMNYAMLNLPLLEFHIIHYWNVIDTCHFWSVQNIHFWMPC